MTGAILQALELLDRLREVVWQMGMGPAAGAAAGTEPAGAAAGTEPGAGAGTGPGEDERLEGIKEWIEHGTI